MAKGFDFRLDDEKLTRLISEHPAQADSWLRGVAEEMVTDIKLGMDDSPATGREYSRGQGRVHTASSPGNFPRPDMGTLRASMRFKRVGALHYEIVDGVEYGIYLEDGTERMAARPFMGPTFDAWRKKIAQDAKDKLIR